MSKNTQKINPELFQIDGGIVIVLNGNNELVNLLTKDDLQSTEDWNKYSKYTTVFLCDLQKDIEKNDYDFDALVSQLNLVYESIAPQQNNNLQGF